MRLKPLVNRSMMLVLRLLHFRESAARLQDWLKVKFSMREIFLKPVLSFSLLTFASRLLAMLNVKVPDLPLGALP